MVLDALTVHALASGSSGNAVLVQYRETNILIDAGVGIRLLSKHLSRLGVGVGRLNAILLTHEHTDHSATAGAISRKHTAPVVTNSATLEAVAAREELAFPGQVLETEDETRIGDMTVRSFSIPHDAVEPVGYTISAGSARLCYATDVGAPTQTLRDELKCASLVILEANHDLEWLRRGPYTYAMKQRVASDTGHLSNADCADLLAERAESSGPFTAWLAHLSRVNNSPALARRTVVERLVSHTRTSVAVEIALRDHPSVSWSAGSHAVQLSLL